MPRSVRSATAMDCCSFSMRCRPASAAPAIFSPIRRNGITPHILASAKGLGNGFPVAACLATEAAAAGMTPGTHGSTVGKIVGHGGSQRGSGRRAGDRLSRTGSRQRKSSALNSKRWVEIFPTIFRRRARRRIAARPQMPPSGSPVAKLVREMGLLTPSSPETRCCACCRPSPSRTKRSTRSVPSPAAQYSARLSSVSKADR